ncbi:MAG: SDR family oxidoreductase [Sulfuriflexus sp.]|nr:SDR family oxidoreductase [Sulfuriflexus sp.]
MQAITIIGCGDIGRRVAALYQHEGAKIAGMVHSKSSVEALSGLGIAPIQANLDDTDTLRGSRYQDNLVFYFAPPPRIGERDTRMANWLSSLEANNLPNKVVLISTTAVYGDSAGEWITELSPTTPGTDRGLRRLDAEQQLKQWADANDVGFVILRVPGIYGSGRLPRERLEKGLPVLNEAECGFTNRIHSDDLAMICVAAAKQEKSAEVFNVSDGHPSTMTDWFNQVADFLKLPRPPQVSMQEAEAVMTAGMLSYLKESRRIDNSKMLNDLDISLEFETIKKGIAASG